ncbi:MULTISPECIES: hypothetical protein [Leptolyngbya]|uniref:hypothetical protein n=1 Tax=Leptolyngbya TaxID=47251 RepID=UPI00168229AB|nr:hypothetical protein [Leptolyngbya sp. FACHB-1624]MBD1859948.1 hypothetical protein [Leptolyngbya sp. FACHB-1624]
MQLSLLFPFSPSWVVSRGSDRFILFFPTVAPMGFADWCASDGVSVLGVAPVAQWRSFPPGVAVFLSVPPAVAAVLSKFPTGGGGSAHPANSLRF